MNRLLACMCCLLVAPIGAAADPPADTRSASDAAADVQDEVTVSAPEPLYVAPTMRDRIGRIWAPVTIDGKGPFRLVLDTGASNSAITAQVAQTLGIPLDGTEQVLLRAVTGSATVPTVRVSSMLVGDLMIESVRLPIVPDALGGAEGVLGIEGLRDKRIFIDFHHDKITIARSHRQSAPSGFVTVPFTLTGNGLLAVDGLVGRIRVKAIIDTGGQATIANLALLRELKRRRGDQHFIHTEVIGTTDQVQPGQLSEVPTIRLGSVEVRGVHVTSGDLEIFDDWKLQDEPAMLVGMDTLGLFDRLVIDYRLREMQVAL